MGIPRGIWQSGAVNGCSSNHFNPFRHEGYRDNLFCIGMIVLGAGIAIGVTSWRSLTLRQIGLVLFPAGVGTGAGYGLHRGLVEQWLRGILE